MCGVVNLLRTSLRLDYEVTMMLLPTLQMLLLMFLLAMLGEPLRFFLLKRLETFSDLDFIQALILDIYLGGLVLYVLAVLPFHLFNFFIVLCLTVLCFLASLFAHFGSLRKYRDFNRVKALFSKNDVKVVDCLLVFGMFLFLLLFNTGALSGLVFGGIFDESIHALKVQVILENGQIPMTLQPYLPEGIVYPAASHVIFAYATQMLNLMVPKSIFYVTLLFKALSVFGAYFLGKKLSSGRTYALFLSFIFTFVSSWPLYIVWGSNPFLVGFPLFLVNLGLFFSLIRREKNDFAELVVIGLLFGYNGSLIVSYIQTLALMAFIICVYWLLRERAFGYRKLYELFVIVAVAVLVLSPVFYRFFIFYPYPGHNIGLPEDFLGYQTTRLPFTVTQALEWAFGNLSPHYLLRFLTLFMLGGLAFWLWKTKNYDDVKSTIAFALNIFFSAALLSAISFFLPSDLEVISWGHQGIIIAISLNILLAVLYAKLKNFFYGLKSERVYVLFSKKIPRNMLVAGLVLLLLNTPFLYYRFLRDPQVMLDTYRMFAVTTEDEFKLMIWMEENVSSNAVILVSPYESGLFIPVISHHKIVYPYTATAFSRSYQNLTDMMLDCVLNQTVYGLMQKLNISHVFVGSNAAYWWFEQRKLDALLFLGNPNFNLVKNFSTAYLFTFNYSNPHVVFFDDFAHERWDEFGWQACYYGNGAGNATIANSSRQGSEALKITAEAVYTVEDTRYVYCVTRKMFVQNNSDISFSFYLNATEGFNGKDTFAFIISNVFRNQSIIITTPGGVYENYAHAVSLSGREGFFEFNGSKSLSSLWRQWYNSTLPSTFILEMVNYDLDGVKNVAYIDNVKIVSTP